MRDHHQHPPPRGSYFVCESCLVIDGTDLAPTYRTAYVEYAQPLLCTECVTGTWHGQFRRVRYYPPRHGFLQRGRTLVPRKKKEQAQSTRAVA
jgi:hypothetical protein